MADSNVSYQEPPRPLFTGPTDSGNELTDISGTRDFYRISGDPLFVRNPARVIVTTTAAKPAKVGDIIKLTNDAFQYSPQSGWYDMGVTRGGLRISRNIVEDGYSIDSDGVVTTMRSVASVEIESAFADMSLTKIADVWANATAIETVDANNKSLGGGSLYDLATFRVAVLQPIYGATRNIQAIRAWSFHAVEIAPTEQSFNFNKTGEPQTLPFKWRALPDPTETDLRTRHFQILEYTE